MENMPLILFQEADRTGGDLCNGCSNRFLTDDHITWAKFTDAAWQGDGFTIVPMTLPAKEKEFSNVNEHHKIYYHKLGEPQQMIVWWWKNKAYPKRFYTAQVSEDERVLFIYESGEGRGNALFMQDLTQKSAPVVPACIRFWLPIYSIEVIGNRIYFFTNYQAAKNKIMAAELQSPELANWKEVVPEKEQVLSDVRVIGKSYFSYDKDASTMLMYMIYKEKLQK